MVTRFAHPCHLVRLPPDLANHVTILIVDPDHVHFPEKTAVLLDFVRGGGGGLPNFLAHFQEVHFWSIKEPITSKLPII